MKLSRKYKEGGTIWERNIKKILITAKYNYHNGYYRGSY
jgi:hypothetical protein